MKGISPLVGTVLLVAITVGIGGLISFWISTFTQTTTRITAEQGEHQVLCTNAAIDISSLRYCNNNMSGIIKNNGRILIGNITLQVVFLNASQLTLALNDSGGGSSGNSLALKSGQIFSFNQSIGGGSSGQYDRIWIYTNCSGVTDLAQSGDVSTC